MEEATTAGAPATSSTIAIAGASTTTMSGTATTAQMANSVYLLQPFRCGEHRDSVDQADLPVAANTYIMDNYNSATF